MNTNSPLLRALVVGEVAKTVIRNHVLDQRVAHDNRTLKKVGVPRNGKCPCGSQKKAKHCCLSRKPRKKETKDERDRLDN